MSNSDRVLRKHYAYAKYTELKSAISCQG